MNDEEADDDILTKRTKSETETKEEGESYKAWLAGQKSEVGVSEEKPSFSDIDDVP